MEHLWPTVLINGAVVILLWSLAWRNHNNRVDTMQAEIDRRVERDYCRLQHDGIKEDIREIKQNQEKAFQYLEEIRMRLARENGIRQVRVGSPEDGKDA